MDLLIKYADVAGYMKAQRIRRIGHIVRTDNDRTVKILGEWRQIAVRRISRQGLRWESDVRGDLEKMKIQNWTKMPMNREEWKRIAELAKTHREL
jgi:hypothetical protein